MSDIVGLGVPSVDPTAGSRTMRMGMKIARWKRAQRVLRFIAPRVDPALLRLSRRRISTDVITPELLLTHKGAKSGLERTATPRRIPIVAFIPAAAAAQTVRPV